MVSGLVKELLWDDARVRSNHVVNVLKQFNKNLCCAVDIVQNFVHDSLYLHPLHPGGCHHNQQHVLHSFSWQSQPSHGRWEDVECCGGDDHVFHCPCHWLISRWHARVTCTTIFRSGDTWTHVTSGVISCWWRSVVYDLAMSSYNLFHFLHNYSTKHYYIQVSTKLRMQATKQKLFPRTLSVAWRKLKVGPLTKLISLKEEAECSSKIQLSSIYFPSRPSLLSWILNFKTIHFSVLARVLPGQRGQIKFHFTNLKVKQNLARVDTTIVKFNISKFVWYFFILFIPEKVHLVEWCLKSLN